MAFATGLRMQACTPDEAMIELHHAHVAIANRLLNIRSSADFARDHWAIARDVRDLTRAVTENLRSYSASSANNYRSAAFRREIRGFIRLHNDGFERNQNLFLNYQLYSDTISRHMKSRVDRWVHGAKEEQQGANDYVDEIVEMMPQ